MSVKLDFTNFNFYIGLDEMLYASNKSSGELFIHDGSEWLTVEEFYSIQFQPLDVVQDDYDEDF